MNSFKLSDVVEIKSGFGRSVNLERDFYSRVSLGGYVLTTTARAALNRLLAALSDETAARAWTTTGAYGSGKSTFSLFAAKLLDYRQNADSLRAQQLVKEKDLNLWRRIFAAESNLFETAKDAPKFFPILISGAREPLGKAILRGVKTALVHSGDARLQLAAAEVETLERSRNVTGKQILSLFQQIAAALNGETEQVGLFVVIDELGKLLEFVALRPGESDVFLLQELAEATKNFKTPFFLMTVLHQAFERYAEKLGRREREEWMKVQGRFEDLAFQEPNEQVLEILQNAFRQNEDSNSLPILRQRGEQAAREAFALKLCGALKESTAVRLLRDCAPLHPLVSLTLGHVFRRFGQNERSLFAFLTSNEPFGLQEFLETTVWNEREQNLVTLECVYDYLVSAMGSQLYAGAEGRKWAEIEAAINRLHDAAPLEIRLLKIIGLLRLLGDLGNLKSSPEVLRFALADNATSDAEIDRALQRLVQKSILIERRYNNTFAVWEGSDVNLDERFMEAERQIDRAVSLAASLTNNFRQRPIVAKRHSYETGTLRYFSVFYADAIDFETVCEQPLPDADARIVYALVANQEELQNLRRRIEQNEIESSAQTVVAVPRSLTNLREAIFATVCWRWVRAHTPELENDRAARSELAARLFHAEQTVLQWLEDLQNNTASENCLWFWRGAEVQLSSARSLQEFLSRVCSEVFDQTPVLKNELLNRRTLSGAATAARRALFEAMLNNADKPQLGIEGFPPQLSMYFSVLQETTIHRKNVDYANQHQNGKYGFYPPHEQADAGIRSVWQRVEDFLAETEIARRTVAELFVVLQAPPFGLKAGVLPVLLAAVLLHFDAEVALYERGNFLPKLSLPIFERLCRSPEVFTLQLCRIQGVRTQVIAKMSQVLLPQRKNEKAPDVLTIVRPLTRFAVELDEYTRHTNRLSPAALGIRRALFSAREPDKLLFKQLPEACGFDEIQPNQAASFDVAEFSIKLHQGLAELKRAYDELLNEIEAMLVSSFGLSETGATGRGELVRRAALIADFAASAKLKSFILRVSDARVDLRAWLESIAALLAGKPPAVWHDADLSGFEIGLAEIVRSFTSLEALAFERRRRLESNEQSPENVEFVRLSFTRMGEPEQERVVAVREAEKVQIADAEQRILHAFEQSGINGNQDLRLSVLANLSLKILQQIK